MLSCATNTAPANGTTIATQTTATLAWNAVATAGSYNVYIWTGAVPSLVPIANVTTNSYTATGLMPSSLYSWYVVPGNSSSMPTGCGISNTTTFTTAAAPVSGTGTGLLGEYYNGISLAGLPLLTRIDPVIDFALTYSTVLSPAPGIVPSDFYSVRWSGQIAPLYSETYTFYTFSDDGIRLWVNGALIIDDWINQGPIEKTGSITLAADQKYDIVVEYFENKGESIAKLSWSSPSTPKAVVPQSQLYPAGIVSPLPACVISATPANASTLTTEATAQLSWTAIATAISYDVYIWTGALAPTVPIANVSGTNYTAAGLTPATTYAWYVVPKNAAGSAAGCGINNKSMFTTAAHDAGTGLLGAYYNDITLTGSPLLTRVDSVIDFAFTYSTVLSPAPGIVPQDHYSVRWAGQVVPLYSESYTFYTLSDDGIRLWVNGILLVDNWVNQGTTEKSGAITLVAGQKYNIVIEYFENTGISVTKLMWSSASTPKSTVPQSQLYPAGQAAAGAMPATLQALSRLSSATANSFAPSLNAMVSPNPVKTGRVARVQISSDTRGTAVLNVVNCNGMVANTQKINLVAGMNTVYINTYSLSQGLYIISITGVNNPVTLKLLVD